VISLGLIGAGRWGRNYIKTIAALDGVRLARLASRSPASHGLVEADCEITADWKRLIDAGDLDGVIVATPPSLHAEMAMAAVTAGIPALVEKPLTLQFSEAVALRDKVRAKNGLVMVDHTHLFHPAFEGLKTRISRLGPVRDIEAEAGARGPYRPDVPVLWDWGAHDVAMCLDLLRESPREVHVSRDAREWVEGAQAETIRLELEFGGGVKARIRLSNLVDRIRRFAVRCDAGELVYDDVARDKLVLKKDGSDMPLEVSPELPLSRAVKAFAAEIAAGRDRSGSLDLGVEVVSVLERCAGLLAAA
jgi:predicted dehydrogenase